MIIKQGALLKFQHHFNLVVNSGSSASSLTDKSIEGDQDTTCMEVDCVNSRKIPSGKLSEDTIREQSKIYGRYMHSKLSDWQKAVNNAAFNMCVEEPDKMYDRAQLKYAAEEEARKTYVFKKTAGSRSKFDDSTSSTKREKMNSESRRKEIAACSLKIQSFMSQVAEKQKQISNSLSIKDFDKCALLQKEFRGLMAERKKQETRLTELQKKEAKHLKYRSKKEKRPSQINCEQAKKPCVTDIRSLMIVKKKTPVREDEIVPDDKGNQSDDTVILSDSDSDIGTKKKTTVGPKKMSEKKTKSVADTEQIQSEEDIIAPLKKRKTDNQTKATEFGQESTEARKNEEKTTSRESEESITNEDSSEENQTIKGDGEGEREENENNGTAKEKGDNSKVDVEKSEERARHIGGEMVKESSTGTADQQNKSNKPDEEQDKVNINEEDTQTGGNFC